MQQIEEFQSVREAEWQRVAEVKRKQLEELQIKLAEQAAYDSERYKFGKSKLLVIINNK